MYAAVSEKNFIPPTKKTKPNLTSTWLCFFQNEKTVFPDAGMADTLIQWVIVYGESNAKRIVRIG